MSTRHFQRKKEMVKIKWLLSVSQAEAKDQSFRVMGKIYRKKREDPELFTHSI
jgi:hypothetical protein